MSVSLAVLVAAAALAGWVDAVIGGGGLILIPMLMATTPLPPAAVLATNKIASVSGTGSAAITLVRRVVAPRQVWVYALVAGLLAGVGATFAALIDASFMRPTIIVLLVAVGVFVAVNPQFGGTARGPTLTRRRLVLGAGLRAFGRNGKGDQYRHEYWRARGVHYGGVRRLAARACPGCGEDDRSADGSPDGSGGAGRHWCGMRCSFWSWSSHLTSFTSSYKKILYFSFSPKFPTATTQHGGVQ